MANIDDIRSIQFNVPFHKGCPDFIKYATNIRKIQQETQTEIQVLQIVRIKGDKKKVEDARVRVVQLDSYLDQNGKQNNKEMNEILINLQNKIIEAEREKMQMAEKIKQLENKAFLDQNEKQDSKEIHQILKNIQNKLQEAEREKAQMAEKIDKFENKVARKMGEIIKVAHKNQYSLFDIQYKVDDLTGDDKVDLGAFYNSAEYNNLNGWGRQPLHIASELGRMDVIRKLIPKCKTVNIKDDAGFTPLHFASANGHFDVVRYLINKNVSINEKDKWGNTALSLAVINGYTDIVRHLCYKKADVRIKNDHYETPLDIARKNEQTEMIKILERCALNLK